MLINFKTSHVLLSLIPASTECFHNSAGGIKVKTCSVIVLANANCVREVNTNAIKAVHENVPTIPSPLKVTRMP